MGTLLLIGGAVLLLLSFVLFISSIVLLVKALKRRDAIAVAPRSSAPRPQVSQPRQPVAQPAPQPAPAPKARVVERPPAPEPVVDVAPDQAATVVVPMASGFGTLECTSGPLKGKSFTIPNVGIAIGREATTAEIVVPDGSVSKRHVWVGPRNGTIAAVDDGSTNGTYINRTDSNRIREAELKNGDVIIIGSNAVAKFEYRSGE